MILDTFTIDFKTNSKAAQQEVAALDKQISQLATKGKLRSQEEEKELKQLRKQRAEATQDIKDQTREVDKLSVSFAKLAESGAAALGAFTAFGAIKSGLLNVTDLNSALNITAKLTGQSGEQLRSLDASLHSKGAGSGNFIQAYRSVFDTLSAHGLPTTDPKKFLEGIRKSVYGKSPALANDTFNKSGLPLDDAARVFISQASPKEWAQALADGAKIAKTTAEDEKNAQEFKNQQARTQEALQTAYNKLAETVLPPLTAGLEKLTGVITKITDTPGGVEAAAGFAGVASIGIGALVAKGIRSMLGLGISGAASGAVALGLLKNLGLIGLNVGLGALIYGGAKDAITGNRNSYLGQGADALSGWLLGNDGKSNKQKINSLLLQGGLSQDNANGVIANLMRESGLDPTNDTRKHGRKENAYGLAQWNPERQATFAKIFGHDIHKSTLEEQVQFILWELNNTHKKTGAALHGANSFNSGSLISSGFEIPANGLNEALKRGNLANDLARSLGGIGPQSSAGSIGKNYSVKIDNVNVHTQATDAKGIASVASSHLISEIRNAFSQLDTGAFA